MSSSFKEKVRKNKFKHPTQMGFKLADWHRAWNQEADKGGENAEIYISGVVIFEILEEIRSNLSDLFKKSPKISNVDLIKIYFSISNRDRVIISKSPDNVLSNNFNLFSATLSNGLMNNELTLQEIADNCVDGLEKAIFHCVKRIQKGEKGFEGSSSSIDVMEFVMMEASLSQLYGIYESYWHALLWGEYKFIRVDAQNKIFLIEQKNTNSEICSLYSHIRKQKLEAQNSAISGLKDFKNIFIGDKYIFSKKQKRKKVVLSKGMSSASDYVAHMNAGWRTKEAFLEDEFPKEVLEKELEIGFSIKEALDVFRCLMLFSLQITEDYPDDDSAYNPNKLKQFCPKIGKTELKRGLVNATQISFTKVSSILDFIAYQAKTKEDLWCNPIIEVNDRDYLLLTSSLITPSITRVVEHWMVQLDIDLQDKGEAYENSLLSGLSAAVSKNSLIKDYDKPVSRRIRLPSSEEEIDLLARFGDLILLGEAKSIVTTDSPISQYRTYSILKMASEQARRKTNFLNKNIKAVFEYLGWEFDENKSYRIVNCVVNSGRMYIGHSVDGIPVVDEKILNRYFSSNQIPYMSTIDHDIGRAVHLAWFELYSDFQSFKSNLFKYLESPPHISVCDEDFEYKIMKLPCINENSYKIVINRLVPKDISREGILKKKHSFPLEMVGNIEEELKKMEVTF